MQKFTVIFVIYEIEQMRIYEVEANDWNNAKIKAAKVDQNDYPEHAFINFTTKTSWEVFAGHCTSIAGG